MTEPPADPPRGGLLIAFEGGDGAGKSTQVGLLAQALRARGRQVVVTRQPGGTPLGAQLRELVLHGEHMGQRAEALLFAADKAQHVHEVVRPALLRGQDVLTDRYTDSSVAYQGTGRALGVATVQGLLDWAVEGLSPDLTVLLDLPASEGRRRRQGTHDRVESEPDPFHERVRRQFLELAAAAPERYLVLDATRPAAELGDAVLHRLRSGGWLP